MGHRRDSTSQGNVVSHNYIHDLGSGDAGHVNTMGVYLDDCHGGDTFFGNVFFRAGRAIMNESPREPPHPAGDMLTPAGLVRRVLREARAAAGTSPTP